MDESELRKKGCFLFSHSICLHLLFFVSYIYQLIIFTRACTWAKLWHEAQTWQYARHDGQVGEKAFVASRRIGGFPDREGWWE